MKTNHSIIGKEVIRLEVRALQKLNRYIGKHFNQAVEAIKKCNSKVILSGVGKSGLIASKISSTLSSVGTPSFFLSANESSHGDLGSISKNDILILISNSGNTVELTNIIKFAKRHKIKLIGITSKKNSILFKNSDIKLLIPQVKEAGLNIVPTASTTLQLALGDAIAVAVMSYKNFNKLDFKEYHPAGNLGKKLTTVGEIMLTKKRIPFISQEKTFQEMIEKLNQKKLGFLIVRDKKLKTRGIFTDGDIKRIIKEKSLLLRKKIKFFMKKNPVSIHCETLAVEAIQIMHEKKITSLCVHDKNKNKTIGVIHIHNLIERGF